MWLCVCVCACACMHSFRYLCVQTYIMLFVWIYMYICTCGTCGMYALCVVCSLCLLVLAQNIERQHRIQNTVIMCRKAQLSPCGDKKEWQQSTSTSCTSMPTHQQFGGELCFLVLETQKGQL